MEIGGARKSVLLIGALVLCIGQHFGHLPCFATDHIVGANRGWQPPANAGPEVHLNYTVWAASQKFYLDDEISFHYPELMQYSVFQVNYSVYTNCTINMWSGHDWIFNWTNKGGRTVIPLNKTGMYYFVDASHCNEGMKVAVNVTKNVTEASTSHSKSASMDLIADMVDSLFWVSFSLLIFVATEPESLFYTPSIGVLYGAIPFFYLNWLFGAKNELLFMLTCLRSFLILARSLSLWVPSVLVEIHGARSCNKHLGRMEG